MIYTFHDITALFDDKNDIMYIIWTFQGILSIFFNFAFLKDPFLTKKMWKHGCIHNTGSTVTMI